MREGIRDIVPIPKGTTTFKSFSAPRKNAEEADGDSQFRGRFTEWCTSLGIVHEQSSSYNPTSNGLAERSVAVVKNMLKKEGAVKGDKLERLMFTLNAMSRESGAGSPLDHFLGRNVKSHLPNASQKVISFRKEIEKRK